MQAGSAWTKTEEKEGKKNVTGISITLDSVITELYPQLKNVRFSLIPLTKEQRTQENSPHWRLTVYKLQEKTNTNANVSASEENEIPF